MTNEHPTSSLLTYWVFPRLPETGAFDRHQANKKKATFEFCGSFKKSGSTKPKEKGGSWKPLFLWRTAEKKLKYLHCLAVKSFIWCVFVMQNCYRK